MYIDYTYISLTCTGITYLDHAGAAVYSASQLQAHMEDLASNLYGNPHSQNTSSRATAEAIDFVRDLVLSHFGTDTSHYDVVFTSGCTGALKLLADVFPWLPVSAVSAEESTDQRQKEQSLFQHVKSHDDHVTPCKCTGMVQSVCTYESLPLTHS